MPAGIAVIIEDGFAVIDFVDPAQRGPGLQRIIEKFGPEIIETMTRSGPRRLYRIPEGNAREAGLLDEGSWETSPAPPAATLTYDDGLPDMDWHRTAMDEYAASRGLDTTQLPNKATVLDAIREAARA